MQTTVADVQGDYPNNGFWSYWNKLADEWSKEPGWWKHIYAFFKLSGQILKDAGIELLFLILFWAIITQMSQGRDLIVGLFEPDNIYTVWRVFYTVVSAVSLSLAMWMVPAFLFQYRDRLNSHRDGYESIFKRHLFFAHRVLPLVPFWLLASVLFNQKGMNWLFLGISILELILLFWFNDKVQNQKKRLWYAGAVTLLLIVAVAYFVSIFEKEYSKAKVVLTVILYLVSLLLHFIFHEIDLQIITEHKKSDHTKINPFLRYIVNTSFYTTFFIAYAIVTSLFFLDNRLPWAPESLMLYIFSFYVFMIDTVGYIINLKRHGKFVVALCFIIISVLYISPVLNFNVSHYSLDSNNDTTRWTPSILRGEERLSFEQRYKKLKDKIDSNKTGQPYPIILISGEGGGSRAGFWFSQNLINFDYYTRGRFREHIFSISTVSGSSVGLSTLFTFWKLTDKANDIDTNWLEFPMDVYANNFVGSSVKGMLLTDLWKSILPFGNFETDRNSLLQDEESYYTQLAANRILRLDTSRNEPTIPNKERILSEDYMNFFYHRNPDTLEFTDKPLVFINSCRSNDGRRSIISPVKLTDSVFNDAIDIAGYMYENRVCGHKDKDNEECKEHKRSISLGQACNLSELFPVFSAPAYIDSLGSFVDGGYHENSGLKTTLDVYTSLKDALKNDEPKEKYEIYIIYFKNGGGEKNLYKPMKSELPILLPLKALTSQPFEGSASYFEEKAKYANSPRFFNISLNNKLIKNDDGSTSTSLDPAERKIEEEILEDLRTERTDKTKPNDSTLKFPLARWLSKAVIKRMRLATFPVKVNPTDDDYRMYCLLQYINRLHGITDEVFDPFYKWTPRADILIKRLIKKCDFHTPETATKINKTLNNQSSIY